MKLKLKMSSDGISPDKVTRCHKDELRKQIMIDLGIVREKTLKQTMQRMTELGLITTDGDIVELAPHGFEKETKRIGMMVRSKVRL
jgi:hypothetical protein